MQNHVPLLFLVIVFDVHVFLFSDGGINTRIKERGKGHG
jgi:hypothetical protein